MLTAEENDRLTRVGPDTPMGRLMRRYWLPVAPTAVLDDEAVRTVTLLGEELVLYRDRSGDYGLVGARCAHRQTHLQFGIPEEHGIRCPYHGWCYDATGACVETPFEPAASRLKDKATIEGYPVQELGGLLWAYMGPAPAPILPRWDFLVWPNSVRQVAMAILPCNWLQCHENGADPFHVKHLHGDFFKYQLEKKGLLEERAGDASTHLLYAFLNSANNATGMFFDREKYGYTEGIIFEKSEQERAWAPATSNRSDGSQQYPYNIFPVLTRVGGGITWVIVMRIPLDDTRTLMLAYHLYHAPDVEAPPQDRVPWWRVPLMDDDGEWILDSVGHQDWACWWSQGPIQDRTKEHLGASDRGVLGFRRLLQEQMEIVEAGNDPMNVFRDQAELGDCIVLEPRIDSYIWRPGDRKLPTDFLFEGYWRDGLERFGGPANELVFDLMKRAAHARGYYDDTRPREPTRTG